MKKVLAISAILLLILALLAACGGPGAGGDSGSENSAGGSAPPVADSSGNSNAAERAPALAVDANDQSNYFAVIDGVKYRFNDFFTIQDLLNAGYTTDPDCDLDQLAAPGVYVGENLFDISISLFKKGVEKFYFKAYPANLTDSPLPLKDCHVYGIYFFNKEADISIAGGLSAGSANNDFLEVFGEPKQQAAVPGYKDRFSANYTSADSYGVISFEYTENPAEVRAIAISYAPK